MTQDREALMVAQYLADLFKIESGHNIALFAISHPSEMECGASFQLAHLISPQVANLRHFQWLQPSLVVFAGRFDFL